MKQIYKANERTSERALENIGNVQKQIEIMQFKSSIFVFVSVKHKNNIYMRLCLFFHGGNITFFIARNLERTHHKKKEIKKRMKNLFKFLFILYSAAISLGIIKLIVLLFVFNSG